MSIYFLVKQKTFRMSDSTSHVLTAAANCKRLNSRNFRVCAALPTLEMAKCRDTVHSYAVYTTAAVILMCRLYEPCRSIARQPETFENCAAHPRMRSTTHTVLNSRFSCQGERTTQPTMFCKLFYPYHSSQFDNYLHIWTYG